MPLAYIGVRNLIEASSMSDNFFDSPALAKLAMRDNLFTEVYLSAAVTTPIHLKGWVTQPTPTSATANAGICTSRAWRFCDAWPPATGRMSLRPGRGVPSDV